MILIRGNRFVRRLSLYRCKLCMTIYVVVAVFFIIASFPNLPPRVVYTHPDELTDKELCSQPGSKGIFVTVNLSLTSLLPEK